MNPTEYYELIVMLSELTNTLFQTWLGFTFALIVAWHIAGPKLNLVILVLAQSLYLFASALFAARYVHTASALAHYNNILIEAGHDPFPPSGDLYCDCPANALHFGNNGYGFLWGLRIQNQGHIG